MGCCKKNEACQIILYANVVRPTLLYICHCEGTEAISLLKAEIAAPNKTGLAMTREL